MHRKAWIAIAFVIVFAIVAVLLVVRPSAPGSRQVVGAVLPLSGDIADYGKRCKAGMDLAAQEINQSGGIDGKELLILYEDSLGRPKDGVSALQKLIGVDDVRFVIGAVSSSVTLAMEPITTRHKIILFSPASSSPKLTGISRYFFRDWPSDVLEATVLAEFVHSEVQLATVAVLLVNNDYGIGLKDEFVRRFTQLGGEVPLVEFYEQGATDFRTQLAKIKARSPQGIYLAGYHREMAFATKQIRELGINCQILGDADYGVQELLEIAGLAAEGAFFSIPEYDPSSDAQAVKVFAKAFQDRYGSAPTIFEANGYDAVKIIAQAIASVGPDPDSVSDFIASLENYRGASGDISFDEKREVVKPISIKKVENGAFVLHTQSP